EGTPAEGVASWNGRGTHFGRWGRRRGGCLIFSLASHRVSFAARAGRVEGTSVTQPEHRTCLMETVYQRRVWGAVTLAAAFFFTSGVLRAVPLPLHDGLISYWPLNEGAGSVANDMAPGGTVTDNGTV